ncbi:MAG: PfkB family carbohydrate kinase [Alphaproteobacteria bacterium]
MTKIVTMTVTKKEPTPRFDVCAVGHITRDIVQAAGKAARTQTGGGAYYAASACRALGLATCVVTRMAAEDEALLEGLRAAGVTVVRRESRSTTVFETVYEDDAHTRVQTALAVADPFAAADLAEVAARAFVLDPLVDEDFGDFLAAAAAGGALVALDAQGLVRKLMQPGVSEAARRLMLRALSRVDVLKADVREAEALTGAREPGPAAAALSGLGPREVIVTMGAQGAVLSAGGRLEPVPALRPRAVVDATGCGDSFLAAYVARRLEGETPPASARFAAALAALKIERHGPFAGSRDEVERRLAEGGAIP